MARAQRDARDSRPGTGIVQVPAQRIDRFLWFARLAADRSSAQALAERAIVRLNGRRVERSHTPVRRGDLLTLPLGDNVRVIRIVDLPVRRGPAVEARSLYEMIETGDANPGFFPHKPTRIDDKAGGE
jgi:ribosome-associated heat shock protein Hsp15